MAETDDLTPEEQQELAALEAEFAQSAPLSSDEQAELAAFEAPEDDFDFDSARLVGVPKTHAPSRPPQIAQDALALISAVRGGSALGSLAQKVAPSVPGLSGLLGGAVGGELGSGVVRESGEMLGLRDPQSIDEDLQQVSQGLVLGVALPPVTKGLLKAGIATSRVAGGALNAFAKRIDNIMDSEKALAHAFTDNPEDFVAEYGETSTADMINKLRNFILSTPKSEQGEIFNPIFQRTREEMKIVGPAIDSIIQTAKQRFQAAGRATGVQFGQLFPVEQFDDIARQFPDAKSRKAFDKLIEDESDVFAQQVLDPTTYKEYQVAKGVLKKYEKQVGAFNLFRGTRAQLDEIPEVAQAQGNAAWLKLDSVRNKLAQTTMPIEDVVALKRRYGKLAQYDSNVDPKTSTSIALYRALEGRLREGIGEFVALAGDDTSRAFDNLNSRFNALAKIRHLTFSRAAEESFGSRSLAPGLSDMLTVSPEESLAIAGGGGQLTPLLEGLPTAMKPAATAFGMVDDLLTSVDNQLPVTTLAGTATELPDMTASARAEELQRSMTNFTQETGVWLEDFNSVVLDGDTFFLEDPVEQQELLSLYSDIENIPHSHIAAQASQFNHPRRENKILPIPKPKKSTTRTPQVRKKKGSSSKPGKYIF